VLGLEISLVIIITLATMGTIATLVVLGYGYAEKIIDQERIITKNRVYKMSEDMKPKPEENLSIDCPSCGTPIQGVSAVHGNDSPNPGDVAVCLACGEIHQFTSVMGLEPVNEDRQPYLLMIEAKQFSKFIKDRMKD
jgi:transcription elongation factor Elf1